ncbi:MAG: molybdopterin molybdotransferase MoeA [Bdellovibrionales bacterium]|nr:molybdopterin molybdotransferase MoeA [Bdellovibrionales bacterium]
MISYQQALSVIRETARTSPPEGTVSLREAVGRVLSHDVLGAEDVPLFDNSAMDGFAVRSADTLLASPDQPLRIPVSGFLAAGDERRQEPFPPGAIEIMTGAETPGDPYDAVIRVEDVEREASGIVLRRPVRAGENVRPRGSDFRAGCTVARAGTRVGAEHVMAFASLGIGSVPVLRRPRVGILATGKELVEPGRARTRPSQIWNSSGLYLEACLRHLGCAVTRGDAVGDDAGAYRRELRKLQESGVDLILSTGAVSMGRHDFVTDAILAEGATIHFHKAAIRPGKPICYGQIGAAAFFGLPGNPVSTAVGWRFFVVPYLRAFLRQKPEQGATVRLAKAVRKPAGLRCFYKGKVSRGEGEVLEGQASYVVSTLLDANGWMVLPEEGESLPAGAEVSVFSLSMEEKA